MAILKTGVVITATIEDDGELNQFKVARVGLDTTEDEEWKLDEAGETLSVEDAEEYVRLMICGIGTVGTYFDENKIKSTAIFLREVIAELEHQIFKPVEKMEVNDATGRTIESTEPKKLK